MAGFSFHHEEGQTMMTTTSRNSVLDRMLSVSRALDQALASDPFLSPALGSSGRPQVWLPDVDMYETDTTFVVQADLPGVHLENIDIGFEQNTLTIRGTRGATVPVPEKGEFRVYTAERVSGNFARAIRLPEYVDGEKIEADFANGVLTVRIPKAASALPRKIAIRATDSAEKKLKA
jgi:HSP20 family protein